MIAACYARSAGARERFAAEFAVRACSTFEGLVNDESLDGIIVMTPNGTHRDLAVAAMRAGRHVLVTKPIATTLKDAADMIRVAHETGRILVVGHQSRRHPAVRALRQLVEANELGLPRLIEGNTSSPTGFDITPVDWRAQAAECPGGPLLQLGIHYVDNFQYLLGPVRTVWARMAKIGDGAVAPDTATVQLKFCSGAFGYLGSSYVTPYSRWIRLSGERAVAEFRADGSMSLCGMEGEVTRVVVPPQNRAALHREMLLEEVQEFVDCIRQGLSPETGGLAGARNLAVVLAAIESHRTGSPVEIEDLLRTVDLAEESTP